jgi:hypothetical protein
MNRDRRTPDRHAYELRGPAGSVAAESTGRAVDRDDVARWVVAAVRSWPGSVEDRLVAVRMGVQPDHVRQAREERPAA